MASMAMPFSACIMMRAPLPVAAVHGVEDVLVGGVEDAGIGHEELEARDALSDELVHLLQRSLGDIRDDGVEGVVDGAHVLSALACHVSIPASRDSPLVWIAKSMIIVVPPQAAARVPVSKVSADVVPPKGISMWVWASMPPGTTYLPVGVDHEIGALLPGLGQPENARGQCRRPSRPGRARPSARPRRL